ncbi:MAG: Ig-like domain-containing protein [Saprospiraceae bacterium]
MKPHNQIKLKSITTILWVIAFLFSINYSYSQEVDTDGYLYWSFELGTEGQLATYSAEFDGLFNQDYVELGSQLGYHGARTNNDLSVTYTLFRPVTQINEPGADNLIAFNITPATGLKFLPSTISFDCERFGTDGGVIDVVWKSSEGTHTTLQTGIIPARANGTNNPGVYHVDITDIAVPDTSGICTLELYLYSLGNTKDAGLANIIIAGHLSGTVSNITKYTINTSTYPENSGYITSNPFGNEFDEGTEISLTANKNFGFNFSHWENNSGDTVSIDNPYTFTLNENTELVAVFNELNVYDLVVDVTGGAKDYMITYSPEGEIVDGIRKYEENTNVTITANENPIIKFTNWSSGETTSELNVTMDQNINLTAEFSPLDYIVGWDFYLSGNNGRIADFYSSEENQSSALILTQENGNTSSWLDKSYESGGYEGRNAAVNWKNLEDKYYYQINFNASDFTDIKITSEMAFNYNAYSTQLCEYSIDGTNFDTLGIFTMDTPKYWYIDTFNLPEIANHQENIFIRWIPDYNSAIVGTTSEKDGTAIAGIYVFGKEEIVDDGLPPNLVSTLPTDGFIGASASGKVVLNFDEKIKFTDNIVATLNNENIEGSVSGKTATFPYLGLEYNTPYVFVLNAGSISDLTDNVLNDSIVISFTTLERPKVTKEKI